MRRFTGLVLMVLLLAAFSVTVGAEECPEPKPFSQIKADIDVVVLIPEYLSLDVAIFDEERNQVPQLVFSERDVDEGEVSEVADVLRVVTKEYQPLQLITKGNRNYRLTMKPSDEFLVDPYLNAGQNYIFFNQLEWRLVHEDEVLTSWAQFDHGLDTELWTGDPGEIRTSYLDLRLTIFRYDLMGTYSGAILFTLEGIDPVRYQ